MQNGNKPTLYLLPVPLADVEPAMVMPMRNIEVARKVKFLIVENLRSARRFLKKCDRDIDIDLLTFFELSEHTEEAEVVSMLEPMDEGHDMAVVSEAGCPAVADPGALAVAEAHRRGYRVVPLVGPSSILLALMASGFNGQAWAFNGYLPVDPGKRLARLKELVKRIASGRQTQIFIETPYRNNKLIEWLCRNLPGDMLLCVACDITGSDEEIVTQTIERWKRCKFNYDKKPAIFLLYS